MVLALEVGFYETASSQTEVAEGLAAQGTVPHNDPLLEGRPVSKGSRSERRGRVDIASYVTNRGPCDGIPLAKTYRRLPSRIDIIGYMLCMHA